MAIADVWIESIVNIINKDNSKAMSQSGYQFGNNYGSTISRFNRSQNNTGNATNQPTDKVKVDLDGNKGVKGQSFHNVSAIDKNVLFQDIIPINVVRNNNKPNAKYANPINSMTERSQQQPKLQEEINAVGVVQTVKSKDRQYESKIELRLNQMNTKINRSKQINKNDMSANRGRVQSGYEAVMKKQDNATDRSVNSTIGKIQRKQEKTRVLKYTDSKQEHHQGQKHALVEEQSNKIEVLNTYAPSNDSKQITDLIPKLQLQTQIHKSPIVMIVVRKWLKIRLREGFIVLKSNRILNSIHSERDSLLLVLASAQIVNIKLCNCLKMGFQIIKKAFTVQYINSFKNVILPTANNCKNTLPSVVDRIYLQRLRYTLLKLSQNTKIKCIKPLAIIDLILKIKTNKILTASLQQLKNYSQHRYSTLTTLSNIVLKINLNKAKNIFNKLTLNFKVKTVSQLVVRHQAALPLRTQSVGQIDVPQNKIVMMKLQSLKKQQVNASENLKSMENSIVARQQLFESQKLTCDLRINALQTENVDILKQVNTKKQHQQQISQQLTHFQSLPLPDFLEQQLPQLNQLKFQSLANLYININRSRESIYLAQDIITQFDLKLQRSGIMQEWEVILRNMELKHQIDYFQIDGDGEYGLPRTVEEDRRVIKKLIRSYIKEQYLWSEIHQEAQ